MTMQSHTHARVQSDADGDQYFDLHTRGFGYLSRVRWVPPKRGRSGQLFLACSINALHGNTSAPNYTKFDVTVVGEEAIELIDQLAGDVEAERKVLVWFTIGDIWADLYMREKRDPKTRKPVGEEEPAAVIKGRLLRVSRIKVDGNVVYETEKPESDENRQQTRPPVTDEQDGDGVVEEQSPAPTSRRPANDEAEQPPARRAHGPGQSRGRDARQRSDWRRTGTHG